MPNTFRSPSQLQTGLPPRSEGNPPVAPVGSHHPPPGVPNNAPRSQHPHRRVAKEMIPSPEFFPAQPDAESLHFRASVSKSCLPAASPASSRGDLQVMSHEALSTWKGLQKSFKQTSAQGNPKLLVMSH